MFKTKPFDHQKEHFIYQEIKRTLLYLWSKAFGKTKVIIDSAAYLYANGAIDLWLLLHLMVFIETWLSTEMPTHFARLVS